MDARYSSRILAYLGIYRDGLMVRTSLRFVPLMISEMKTTQIEPKIEHLKQQLTKLGPMHPGSLSEQ